MNHPSKIKARSEIALALLLSCAAAGLWIVRPVLRLTHESTSGTPSRSSPSEIKVNPTTPTLPAKGGSVRRVYGHSLVAGGIHSIEELMAVIARDPQLAQHYENFDLSKAHIVTLDHNVVAYVSYRLNKGIYWEAKPSIIAKGEQVITDGTNFIRVRCGNRISYAPGPISPGEPEDMDIVVALTHFDPPPAEPTPEIPELPITAPPVLVLIPPPPPPRGWWPPVFFPCCGGGPPRVSADEFSRTSLTILGRSYKLPSEGFALMLGVLVVLVLRLAHPR